MKRLFALFLAMTFIFISIGTTTVLAAEQINTDFSYETSAEDTIILPRSTATVSDIMDGGATNQISIPYVGKNTTFTYSISGNPSLYVDVFVQIDGKTPSYLLTNIPCDGTTYEIPLSNTSAGKAIITTSVNHGSSWGEDKTVTVTATW